ncbi:MAG: hypothetical protein WCN95_12890 [bacterium]
MKVVNLNSPFEWTRACADIVEQVEARLPSADVGVQGDSWRAVSSERLSKLKWLFLVDELCLRAQVEDCPQGEDAQTEDRESAKPPFCRRQGGKNQERSSINGRPIQLAGGGIVEPLGVYVTRVREFAKGAFLLPKWQRKSSVDKDDKHGMGAIEDLLPNDVRDEPAIFICPERLFRLPCELADALRDVEPHPDPDRNWTELFLRMTILHEIGHHLLPAPPSTAPVVSEALANSFCSTLLTVDERPWLFAKAWLLQPSMYLAWFVPGVWSKAGLASLSASWSATIHASLGLPVDARGAESGTLAEERWIESSLAHSGIPMSPQFRHAFSAMLEPLCKNGHVMHMRMELDMMLSHSNVCDWSPFEEYGMLWNDAHALLRMLADSRPTVAAAAFRLLDRVHRPSDASSLDSEPDLNATCDRFLATDSNILAQEAWRSERAKRQDGVDVRFTSILESPHAAVAEAMLHHHFRDLFPADRQEAVLRKIVGSARITPVRAAAAQALADLLCAEKNDNKAAWEWLIQEENYLVYAAGAQRAFKDSSAVPVDVAFGATRSVDKAVEQESAEQKLEYAARNDLRERLQTKQRDVLGEGLKLLHKRCEDSCKWPDEFQEGVEKLLRTHVKAYPRWSQGIVKSLPKGIRSRMLLGVCAAKEWALAAIILDNDVDLSSYFALNRTDEKSGPLYRKVFIEVLVAYDMPVEIVSRMAKLPEALLFLAEVNMVRLMEQPESTKKRLLEVIVTSNCSQALKALLQKWKPSDDERRKFHSLAVASGSGECAELLNSGHEGGS